MTKSHSDSHVHVHADAGFLSPAEIKQFLKRYPNIHSVRAMIVDMLGLVRGKEIPIKKIFDLCQPKLCLPKSILLQNSLGKNYDMPAIDSGDSDYFASGLAGTLFPAASSGLTALAASGKPGQPKIDPKDISHAQVFLSLHNSDGKPFLYGGRELVKKMAGLIKEEFGFDVSLAIELEFSLFKKTGKGDAEITNAHASHGKYSPLANSYASVYDYPKLASEIGNCYGMEAIEELLSFTDVLRESLALSGIELDGLSSEYGKGQFEINLNYRKNALLATDEAILFKHAVKTLAKPFGMSATFMALANEESSNGMHINLSLQNSKGENVMAEFPVKNKAKFASPSKYARYAIAGLQKTAREAMLIFAPNPNSYKRFYVQNYVPYNIESWGLNNRRVALRLPALNPSNPDFRKAMRIEHRIAGADSNVYLSVAAVLAGVYLGLKLGNEPSPMTTNSNHPPHPPPHAWELKPENMARSLSAWAAPKNVFRELFGNDFCDVFHQQRLLEYYNVMATLNETDFTWYSHY